jgi:predicted permease
MRAVRAFLVRLGGLFGKGRRDRELAEEIESHLQLHVEDNLRAGMSPEEAWRQARLKFGGVEAMKESYRDRRGLPLLETLAQDLRYAIRRLRRSPGFTAVAALSLALGIGANTAIFSLMDSLLFRMLPVKDPERFYTPVFSNDRFNNQPAFAMAAYEEFRDHNDVFSDLLCRRVTQVGLLAGDRTEPVSLEQVSGNYFSMLGVRAHLGRMLGVEDDRPAGGQQVAVLSYEFWQRRFGSDPAILGKAIHLNGVAFVVVGVSEPRFYGLDPGFGPEMRVPVNAWLESQPGWNERARQNIFVFNFNLVGRLKPGVSVHQAETQLAVLHRRWLEEQVSLSPGISDQDRRRVLSIRITLTPAAKGLFGLGSTYQQSLPLLLAAAGLVLLIACVNLATLLLAKAAGRQREIAVRLSLGAGRGRVLRQLFTESLLLAALGGVLSLPVSVWAAEAMTSFVPPPGQWRLAIPVTPDWRVLGFLAGVTLLTSVLFGLAPALQATRLQFTPTLQGATSTGTGRFSAGKLLVSAQVALSLVLLAGAGLLLRTLQNLRRDEIGFEKTRVLMFSLNADLSNHTPQRARAFYQDLVERVSALPGVQLASLDRFGLLGRSFGIAQMALRVEGYEPQGDEASNPLLAPQRFVVGPNFFRTVGIPLVLGREFSRQDNETAPKVAVVNERLARYYFGGQNPIGRRIGWGKADIEIVGVARDAKYYDLREQPLRAFYVPYTQLNDRFSTRMTLLVRSSSDRDKLIAAVRREVHAVDRNVPLTAIKTVETKIDETLSTERLLTSLAGAFGLLSALLTAIGLYGVTAYSVVRRTQEIGIRMALGARRGDVLRLVVRRGMVQVAVGLALGLAAAYGLTRFIAGWLYGVKPTDPATLAAVTLLLLAVALAACYLPARRAARLDPMVALRTE